MSVFSRRKIRIAGLAGILCAAALVLSSCVSIGEYGGHKTMSFWKEPTDKIVGVWASPTCDQDYDHDGYRGTAEDRALCAFFLIRLGFCNKLAGLANGYCNAATEPYALNELGWPLWFDFHTAATRRVQNNWACLQVTIGGYGEIRRWTAAPLGHEGCRTMSG